MRDNDNKIQTNIKKLRMLKSKMYKTRNAEKNTSSSIKIYFLLELKQTVEPENKTKA